MFGMSTQAIGPASGEVPLDTWATRLVIARTQRGLTVDQAADRAGLNRSSWSNWEKGKTPRSQVAVTQAIAEALGYDLNWLLLGGPLATEHGPGGGGKRPRQDSNLRPTDYSVAASDPISLSGAAERRRNSRASRTWNPLRRNPSRHAAAA